MKDSSRFIFIRILAAAIVLIALFSIGGIIFWNNRPEIIQGRIECQSSTVSGKLIGRIDQVYVNEGDTIEEGDTLVSIYSPEIRAQLTSASAMEEVALYQNRKIDAGTRKEIVKSLEEAYNAAHANFKLAEKSLTRSERLSQDSIITPQRLDEVRALYKNAKAAKEAAHYQYKMAQEGAQQEDKESSKAMVKAAKGNVRGIESLLADSKLTSAISGEVSSIYLTRGELVMPGSAIMEIINTDSSYVVINVKENDLNKFYMGSEFFGRIPAFNNARVAFRVFYISPMGSFANWSETKGGNSYNLATFRIKARPIRVIDTKDGNTIIGRLRPGMTVLVELDTIDG